LQFRGINKNEVSFAGHSVICQFKSEGWGGGGEGGDVDATKMMRLDEANFLECSGPLFFLVVCPHSYYRLKAINNGRFTFHENDSDSSPSFFSKSTNNA